MARTIGEIRARWDVSRWQDWGYEEDEAHSHAAQDVEWLLERVRRLELALRVADARWASLIVMSGVLGLDGDIRGRSCACSEASRPTTTCALEER
jgi:hypothetical protein